MTVLITRPQHDADETAAILHRQNITTLIDPMLHVTTLDMDCTSLPICDHIIFTSKNGVRSFCHNNDHRDFTAWCVGNETAKCAQSNGFKIVQSADGNADDLITLIKNETSACSMIRIARHGQKDRITDTLRTNGYTITTLELYRITTASTFKQDTLIAFENNDISDIVFFSPKTAKATAENFSRAHLVDTCRSITAWCISKATVEAIDNLPFKNVMLAKAPNQKDLLDPLISRTLSNG